MEDAVNKGTINSGGMKGAKKVGIMD